ncbi:armadillo-type protein [Mycena sp. CBHHK59/15]|nr:armadillo-type protein [Mycena sp. CBHHK59/15]
MSGRQNAPPGSVYLAHRKTISLLNKLVTSNFDSIAAQILAIVNQSAGKDDARTLITVIRLCCESAISQPIRSELYARLSRALMERISPEVRDDGIKNAEGKAIAGGQLFRKYLVNTLQEDFEKGWAPPDVEGTKKRKYLGLVRFLGAIFKMRMLTERIMHECVKKLITDIESLRIEADIEALCVLLETTGSLLDTPKARAHMDVYFSRKDLIDLRTRKWAAVARTQLDDGAAAGGNAPRPPPKAGDRSNFGKINSTVKGIPMTFGPSGVFSGKKDYKRESLSRKSLSSNMFSMLSQNPDAASLNTTG